MPGLPWYSPTEDTVEGRYYEPEQGESDKLSYVAKQSGWERSQSSTIDWKLSWGAQNFLGSWTKSLPNVTCAWAMRFAPAQPHVVPLQQAFPSNAREDLLRPLQTKTLGAGQLIWLLSKATWFASLMIIWFVRLFIRNKQESSPLCLTWCCAIWQATTFCDPSSDWEHFWFSHVRDEQGACDLHRCPREERASRAEASVVSHILHALAWHNHRAFDRLPTVGLCTDNRTHPTQERGPPAQGSKHYPCFRNHSAAHGLHCTR